ncbi:MAG: 30S ribosomal protein S7 [Thermodesulfobacteriota bacterium]|nr:30S ribosomal protein S7 [Thermodesulfobacteriota bacterium]
MARKKSVANYLTENANQGNSQVNKLINCVMKDGKKSIAVRVVNDALKIVEEKSDESAIAVFEKAVGNIRPAVEVKSRRVGGSTYQVPTEIKGSRRTALAFRWLLRYSRARSEKGMARKLASELLDAFNERGGAVKKREDTHKMAEANKAFAHFRW